MRAVPNLTPAHADAAHAAAQCVVETHRRLAQWLRVGVTCAEVDVFVAEQLYDMGGKSCFLGYAPRGMPGFPSHACHSVNDCVVHGTATTHTDPIKEGDVYSIDIGVFLREWVGDAAWTYVFGEPSDEVRRLCSSGKESLARGVRQLRPENTWMEWARVVQEHVEDECGFHLVRGLGGHGIGKRKLHGPPFVSNVVPILPGEWPDGGRMCQPGTLLAVEPMIAIGTGETLQQRRRWPILTADGSLAVHYEHDVLVTEDGPRVLTEGLEDLPDVIG